MRAKRPTPQDQVNCTSPSRHEMCRQTTAQHHTHCTTQEGCSPATRSLCREASYCATPGYPSEKRREGAKKRSQVIQSQASRVNPANASTSSTHSAHPTSRSVSSTNDVFFRTTPETASKNSSFQSACIEGHARPGPVALSLPPC